MDYTISGASGSSYTDFSGKSLTSAAVYAGNAAAGNNSIQLRSDKSTAGIVTTTSGGTVKKITIEWNTNTTAKRTLNVYGKSEAYTVAKDLFDETKQGTLIKSYTYATKGTAQTDVLEIEGNYPFIGLRSNSGAMYIDKITIEWEVAADAVADPTFTPVTGTKFDDSQEVTINFAEGTTVWYTTDESTPEKDGETSTMYTEPFTINATTTVKAIAVKGDKVSNIVSATYTKREWLDGLSDLVAKIQEDNSSTAKEYYVDLKGAVVTGVLGTYAAYFEEGETGIYLNKSDHGLTLAQKYSGKATVTAKMNKGLPQLTDFECATFVNGVELPLATVTLAELNANFNKYLSRRIKIENAVTNTALESSASGEIGQGETNLAVYVNATLTAAIEKSTKIDVIGWPNYYNGNPQLNIWSAKDITDKGSALVFKFSTDAVSALVGGTVVAPELENTYDDKNVIYTSSNPAVATVDATGAITIVAEGETVITASLQGGQTASYSLTVKTPVYYNQVTSADDLVVGAKYVFANNSASYAMGAAMQNNSGGQYRGQVAVNFQDGGTSVIEGPTDGLSEFVLLSGTQDNTWVFYEEGVGYLSLTSDANALATKEELTDKSFVTIDINEQGEAVIVFQSYTDRTLRYNSNNDRFACYQSGQAAVQLYRLDKAAQNSLTIGADGYATFYTDKAFVMPKGVEGCIISAAEAGKLTLEYNYAAGTIVPAKTALLLKGAAGEYEYYDVTSEEAAPADNLLHGADAVRDGKTFVDGTSVKYYVLSKKNGENLGFYWAEADGAATDYQAGKAFLAVDFGSEAKVYSMYSLDGTTTGINDVETRKAGNGRIYNLTGVCVGNNAKALPKGIYIVNGKKVVY